MRQDNRQDYSNGQKLVKPTIMVSANGSDRELSVGEMENNIYEPTILISESGSDSKFSGGDMGNIIYDNIDIEAAIIAENLSTLNEKKILIKNNRVDARKNLEAQANKMLAHSQSLYAQASIGDTVKVAIPEMDRGKTDPRNLLCTVLSVDNTNQLYKLGTKEGKLKQLYTRNEFDVCKQKLMTLDEIPEVDVTVREVVRKQSLIGGQGFKKCNCKQGCNSKKCQCKAIGILCNSKCHNSSSCCNKG